MASQLKRHEDRLTSLQRDMLQHLWNNHAKHGNRGGLFYKFLSFFQKRQQTCSVCNCHPTAVQCPVLLQLASLLAILHHGHGGQPDLRNVGGPESPGEDGGGRGQAERKAPEVFHVEWREGPGKRKRKKRAGEDPEHQGRIHTRFKDTPECSDPPRSSTRRHASVSGHGDGLLRFFERGTRLSSSQHDDTDADLAADSNCGKDPSTSDLGPENLAGRTAEEDSEASIHGLLRSLDPDIAAPELFAARAREGRLIHISTDEVEFPQAADGGTGGRTSDHESGHPDSDQDAHFASARSPDQKIRSPTSPTADPEGHETPSAIIPWRITVALVHPNANEMRGLWHQLSHSGLWQLVLGRMRPASSHRTPLAQHVGKMPEQL